MSQSRIVHQVLLSQRLCSTYAELTSALQLRCRNCLQWRLVEHRHPIMQEPTNCGDVLTAPGNEAMLSALNATKTSDVRLESYKI